MLKGIAASEGIGIGTVMIIEEHSLAYTPRTIANTDAEIQHYQNAIEDFCKETVEQAEALKKSAGKKEAEILEGHIQMAKDIQTSRRVGGIGREHVIVVIRCGKAELSADLLRFRQNSQVIAEVRDLTAQHGEILIDNGVEFLKISYLILVSPHLLMALQEMIGDHREQGVAVFAGLLIVFSQHLMILMAFARALVFVDVFLVNPVDKLVIYIPLDKS